jgi:hypothetical protein
MNKTIHIRLSEQLDQEIRRVGLRHGLHPSEAIRQLLCEALRARQNERPTSDSRHDNLVGDRSGDGTVSVDIPRSHPDLSCACICAWKQERERTVTYHLYRHFDANGALLYVGYSEHVFGALSSRNYKPWYQSIASVTIDRFETYAQVLKAKQEAKLREKPLFPASKKQIELRARYEAAMKGSSVTAEAEG